MEQSRANFYLKTSLKALISFALLIFTWKCKLSSKFSGVGIAINIELEFQHCLVTNIGWPAYV
jgi:hypothetical protein